MILPHLISESCRSRSSCLEIIGRRTCSSLPPPLGHPHGGSWGVEEDPPWSHDERDPRLQSIRESWTSAIGVLLSWLFFSQTKLGWTCNCDSSSGDDLFISLDIWLRSIFTQQLSGEDSDPRGLTAVVFCTSSVTKVSCLGRWFVTTLDAFTSSLMSRRTNPFQSIPNSPDIEVQGCVIDVGGYLSRTLELDQRIWNQKRGVAGHDGDSEIQHSYGNHKCMVGIEGAQISKTKSYLAVASSHTFANLRI